MRIDRVKYTAHYDEFGFIKDQWVGFEGSIDDTEDPEKQATVIKEMTERWYKTNNINKSDYPLTLGAYHGIPTAPPYGPNPSPIITVERTSETERIAKLIKDIYACTELDGDNGLLSYSKLAATNREAQNCFDIMFMKLSNK